MDDITIEEKQSYLTSEIIKQGYDAQEFSVFLSDQKGEERIDLEYWSMEDLKKAVENFKQSILNKNMEKNSEKLSKRRHSSAGHNDKRKNKKKEEVENYEKTGSQNQIKRKNLTIKKGKKIDLFNDMMDSDEDNELSDNNSIDEESDETKIKCVKLSENKITNRNDLYIEINLEEKIKNNIDLNSIEFMVETKPIGFKTKRKINDFEYLNQKLPLINSEIFNPFLYLNKSNSKEINSNETIIYLKLYMNSLIQNPYFRTLSIVYDFLTLSIEEWEKIKINKYDQIKEANKREKIPNLEGYFNLEIEAGDDEKCLKIKNELTLKNEAFIKFNNLMNELLNLMDKFISTLKNISESFRELRNRYNSSPNMTNLFAHLEIIVKVLSEGYSDRKKFLNNEFKYFFKYMNKENNSFIKYYENFKISYDDFKTKFDKMSKILYPSKKDKNILKKLQKEFSFKLVNVYGEYQKLNEYQAKRIENKLNKISTNKSVIFKDIENIYGLLNFFSIKQIDKEKEEQIKTENKIEENNKKEKKEEGMNLKEDNENKEKDKIIIEEKKRK